MTKHKAKFIFHMKVPTNEEDELTDMDKQDIALHIQPGFTGWREKLLLYLPNLMQNSKIDRQWFVHPINEFVRKHHMLDSEGKLQLNTQTDDKHKLALMYRLWLLIKKRMRYYRMSNSRIGIEQKYNAKLAERLYEINKRENEHLKEMIKRLEQKKDDLKDFVHCHPPAVVFDSSDDEEMEV